MTPPPCTTTTRWVASGTAWTRRSGWWSSSAPGRSCSATSRRHRRWWPTSAAAPAGTRPGWPDAVTGSSTATWSPSTSSNSAPAPATPAGSAPPSGDARRLEVVDLVGVEGLAFALGDLDQRLDDPVGRAVVLDAARAVERVPELLGLGPHLLATARRPTG